MLAMHTDPMSPPRLTPVRGGQTVQREKKRERLNLFLEESLKEELREFAARNNEDLSELTRRALVNEMKGRPAPAEDGFRTFTAPYLAAVPCGPWDQAWESDELFSVTTEVADELEAREGDRWIRANGQSMEGAGIMDGFLVLVRPLDGKTPRRGEIILVQVTNGQGECVGTLKRFGGLESDGKTPKLLDGHEDSYALPDDVERVEYIGRAVGVLGRL